MATTLSSSPKKEAYRAFNRSAKKFLCYCRDAFPELESPVNSALILLKITKSVSVKFNFKIYMELFDEPYRSYLDVQDTAFFIGDEFSIKFMDEIVTKFKSAFRGCQESDRQNVWLAAQDIFDARDTIVKMKTGDPGSDTESEL